MRPPSNLLEHVIYEWLSASGIIPGGAQEKVAAIAYELAKEISDKIYVDVDRPVGDWLDRENNHDQSA